MVNALRANEHPAVHCIGDVDFDLRSRGHRLGGFTQLIVDQSEAFPLPEPNVARPDLPRADVFRSDIRIEQPHGRVEMREVGSVPGKLLFKLSRRSRKFRALVS